VKLKGGAAIHVGVIRRRARIPGASLKRARQPLRSDPALQALRQQRAEPLPPTMTRNFARFVDRYGGAKVVRLG
jgi:hypothetical protein